MKVDFQVQLWQINSLDVFTLILTTRKSWTNWKTVTFLKSVSKLRSQGKPPPQFREMGRYREARPRSAYWEQKLLELGTGRNTEGNFVEFWRLNEELESSKFLGTQSRGGGSSCLGVYLQNPYQILTVTVRKRAPHVSVPKETCCNKVWSERKEGKKKRIQKHF